ncbi:hypothetical protein ACWCQK_38335 [Streptomyces sp. NPDC002306]
MTGDFQKEAQGGIAAESADHGLGRSRGALTNKIHVAVEQGQKPLSVVITAGLRGDFPRFEAVLEAMRVPRIGLGRLRKRADRVRADKTPHAGMSDSVGDLGIRRRDGVVVGQDRLGFHSRSSHEVSRYRCAPVPVSKSLP